MVEYLDHLKKTAERKFIKESFEYLDLIEQPQNFKIVSNFPVTNNVDIDVKKAERAFTFITQNLNLTPDFSMSHDEGHGLLRPFSLRNNKYLFVNPKGAGKLQISFGDEIIGSGELWEIENNINKSNKGHFRLIIQKPYNPPQDHNIIIQSREYTHEDAIHLRGLTEINCNNNIFNLFEYTKDSTNYIILDTITQTYFNEFEKFIQILTFTLGFITGIIPGNEIYILQSDNKEFTSITGFKYKRVDNILISGMTLISPLQIDSYLKVSIDQIQISEVVFSNLLTRAITDSRFFRAIKIISEANIYPMEIKASAYYVALEAIKNKILEENEDKVNPFKNKKIAKEVIEDLKKQIDSIDDSLFNNKQAILSKLGQLNQVTNKDSFKIAFDLMGLKLTKYDDDALLKRNDFLHGRIPFEDEEESKKDQELKYITYKMHFLVSVLILKYVGFNGFVKNNPRFSSLYTGNKLIDESFFRYI